MEDFNMELHHIIQKLLYYAKVKLGLQEFDSIYVQNQLLDLFHLTSMENTSIDEKTIENLQVPDVLLEELRTYLKENTTYNDKEIERLLVKVMGIITPMPNDVISHFTTLEKENPQTALDYLYQLEIYNNYIQKTAVDRNLYWKAEFPTNYLEITINLSKPEKKNSDIAKLVGKKDVSYPKCLLCLENLGYAGRDDHPARQNIRMIPVSLNDEHWFLQYSPYVYYYEHCIVICGHHEPMQMGRRIYANLLSFVDRFPCFFVGSNSELPIVGGSILNHEHFQGGSHLMPMMFSHPIIELENKKYKHTKIEYLDWYASTLRLTSKNKEELLDAAEHILAVWRDYQDEEIDIIPHSNGAQHNTTTPIARKVDDNYVLYLILRNNRTNETYPDGIFHAHPEYHNIKSEGIGLIEAMGMFILPARLERQTKELAVLLNDVSMDVDEYFKEHEDLKIHRDFIVRLRKQLDHTLIEEEAIQYIRNEISTVCMHILGNVAVFKQDEKGNEHFMSFAKKLDL